MSLYVVKKERDAFSAWVYPTFLDTIRGNITLAPPVDVFELRDCNARDGEWSAVITLAHETVEFEGLAVPVFEGDVERREWEAKRRRST